MLFSVLECTSVLGDVGKVVADEGPAPISSALWPVESGGRWGYINRVGEVVVPLRFLEARAYDRGVAFVRTKDCRGAVIGARGRFVIPPILDGSPGSDVRCGDGLLGVMVSGVWGFADQSGRFAIPAQFGDVGCFSEGRGPVEVGGKWGYVDAAGRTVIAPRFDLATAFANGLAVVGVRNEDKHSVVVAQGRQTGGWFGVRRGRGLRELLESSCDLRYGAIDRSGQCVVGCRYRSLGAFREAAAVAQLVDGRWTLVRRDGQPATAACYASLGPFHDGLAVAATSERRMGYVDSFGTVVVDFLYTQAQNFSEGLAVVELNGRYGAIDTRGRWLIAPVHDCILECSEGRLPVMVPTAGSRGGNRSSATGPARWGFLDRHGRVAIPARFDSVFAFSGALAVVEEAGVRGYINRWGNYVWPPEKRSLGVIEESGRALAPDKGSESAR